MSEWLQFFRSHTKNCNDLMAGFDVKSIVAHPYLDKPAYDTLERATRDQADVCTLIRYLAIYATAGSTMLTSPPQESIHQSLKTTFAASVGEYNLKRSEASINKLLENSIVLATIIAPQALLALVLGVDKYAKLRESAANEDEFIRYSTGHTNNLFYPQDFIQTARTRWATLNPIKLVPALVCLIKLMNDDASSPCFIFNNPNSDAKTPNKCFFFHMHPIWNTDSTPGLIYMCNGTSTLLVRDDYFYTHLKLKPSDPNHTISTFFYHVGCAFVSFLPISYFKQRPHPLVLPQQNILRYITKSPFHIPCKTHQIVSFDPTQNLETILFDIFPDVLLTNNQGRLVFNSLSDQTIIINVLSTSGAIRFKQYKEGDGTIQPPESHPFLTTDVLTASLGLVPFFPPDFYDIATNKVETALFMSVVFETYKNVVASVKEIGQTVSVPKGLVLLPCFQYALTTAIFLDPDSLMNQDDAGINPATFLERADNLMYKIKYDALLPTYEALVTNDRCPIQYIDGAPYAFATYRVKGWGVDQDESNTFMMDMTDPNRLALYPDNDPIDDLIISNSPPSIFSIFGQKNPSLDKVNTALKRALLETVFIKYNYVLLHGLIWVYTAVRRITKRQCEQHDNSLRVWCEANSPANIDITQALDILLP